MTAAYYEICDDICDFDWYAYPIEMQKILPLIMINAQEPVVLECFGKISCARDVFKSVKHITLTHLTQTHFNFIDSCLIYSFR